MVKGAQLIGQLNTNLIEEPSRQASLSCLVWVPKLGIDL